jgi:voltage-gated potassium channel
MSAESSDPVVTALPPESSLRSRRQAQAWDLFMVVAALASLLLIAWVELQDLDWPDPTFRKCAIVDLAFVAIFLFEFVVRLVRSPDRRRFWKENWYDLPGLVPLYAESLSWLRVFRVLRIIRVLRLLRLFQALRRLRRAVAFVNRVYEASHLTYTFSLAMAFVLVMSTGFWILEHGKNPALISFDDAVWWAISTATTVGYGDIAPATGPGRLLASALMLFGIGLVGVVASSLSAAIVRIRQEDSLPPLQAVLALIDHVEDLVVRRERGELSQEEYERKKSGLVALTRIKTE